MALFSLRAKRTNDALQWAEKLPIIAPWRAASYDWLSYVAQQIGRMEIASKAHEMGNEVFKQEKALFEDLRSTLGQA